MLFGSVTPEQLVSTSGKEDGSPAPELAHMVLVMLCTNLCNGLMPDLKRHPCPFRSDPKRFLGLIKELKVTEVAYHKGILLSFVKGRPPFVQHTWMSFLTTLKTVRHLPGLLLFLWLQIWFPQLVLACPSVSSIPSLKICHPLIAQMCRVLWHVFVVIHLADWLSIRGLLHPNVFL